MVKLIATSIAYYLGYRTGSYVVPPIANAIKNNEFIQQVWTKTRKETYEFFGFTVKEIKKENTSLVVKNDVTSLVKKD